MKKITLLVFTILFSICSNTFSSNIIYPIRYAQMDESERMMDNPKGKWKIRFLRTEDKSDTTNSRKGFLNKLKDIVSNLLNLSENPPFKVEIVREKEKEKKN
jgi:hypothetical protein